MILEFVLFLSKTPDTPKDAGGKGKGKDKDKDKPKKEEKASKEKGKDKDKKDKDNKDKDSQKDKDKDGGKSQGTGVGTDVCQRDSFHPWGLFTLDLTAFCDRAVAIELLRMATLKRGCKYCTGERVKVRERVRERDMKGE